MLYKPRTHLILGGKNMMGGSIIGIIALILAILVIYDVFANQRKMSTGMKILWTVLALMPFNIITAIVYYFVVYNK